MQIKLSKLSYSIRYDNIIYHVILYYTILQYSTLYYILYDNMCCCLAGVPGARFINCLSFVIHRYGSCVTCYEMTPFIPDNNLYTTTNKCLQCLRNMMYTVF